MYTKKNFIISFVLLLALACGSGSGGGSSAGGSGGQQQEVQSFTIGQDVAVGDIRWKVLDVKDLGQELKSDNEFIDPKTTGGKFIQVRLEVENRKSEAATYGGIDLVDDKDRTFQRYAEQLGYIPENELCLLEQLNPNLTKTCTEIFELPADAKGLKAKLGDLELLGSKEALVSLGL